MPTSSRTYQYSNGNRRQPRRQAKGPEQGHSRALLLVFVAHKNRARLWAEYDRGFSRRCSQIFFAVPDFRISLPMAHYPSSLGSGAGYMAESDPTRSYSTHSGPSGSPRMGSQGTGPFFASFRAADPSTTPTRSHRGFPGYATNYSGASTSGQSPEAWTGGHPTNFSGTEQGAGWTGYPYNSEQPGPSRNNAYPSQSYSAAAPLGPTPRPQASPSRRTKHHDATAATALQFHDHGHYTPSDKGRPKPSKVACNFCRSRKIRCDGDVPCAKCKAAGQECVYETTTRRGWHSETKSVYVQAEIEARRSAAAAAGRR
uniref:Zn(2)-C6 fungal-type domain-containing protein n=1 Tax=Mycena chlorophos TaxID=658473 RepID=A0ABQ0LE70_MYCCL|nr:predicted protein [Mycena chlorophos]